MLIKTKNILHLSLKISALTIVVFIFMTGINTPILADDLKKENDILSQYEEMEYTFEEPLIVQNPYSRNELSALVKFPTEKEAQIELSILPKKNESVIKHLFKEFKVQHEVPIYALFPNHDNKIILKAIFKDGSTKTSKINIKTPKIKKQALYIVKENKNPTTAYHYFHGGIVFDTHGNVRLNFLPEYEMLWFLNGEFIAEDRNQGIIRYNMLGKKLQTYPYPKGFTSFTHGLTQKPNKNFLIVGSFDNQYALFEGEKAQTSRDFVIELDYQTGALVNKIDLAELLNPDRTFIIKSNTKNYGLNNWCHINSVSYDLNDKGILVSCRHAGLFKINEQTKEILYIISPHTGFEKSGRNGNGLPLKDKLLTALDKNGVPLSLSVQTGKQKHPDFKWPTKTHDAKILSDNIVSVFDNSGDLFDKEIITSKNSIAQVFKINPDKKTIQNIFFYPLDVHSESGSSVIYNKKDNKISIFASIVKDSQQQGIGYGKLLELNLKTKEKLFESILYRGGETYFYGIMPFNFYPEEE